MKKKKRIMAVDDEQSIRENIKTMLEMEEYEVELAQDGYEALVKLELGIDLILMDVIMPGMDGFEVVRKIREKYNQHELPIIMVTGMSTRQDRIRAVEVGANDFVSKPFDFTEIRVRCSSLLEMKGAHDELRRHKNELEVMVAQRTAALRKALDNTVEAQRQLREAHLETIQRLVVAAEFKDRDTAMHVQRMSRFSALIAQKMNLSPSEVELILHASPMHDIGKIGTPGEILLKPGKLTEDEWKLMRQHTIYGEQILKNSSSELLKAGEIIALTHHEKWDGSGYPHGLVKTDIPLYGRISAVADVFDAITSPRPYKPAYSNDYAVKILHEGRKKHFDPDIVDVFIDNIDEVTEIQRNVDHKEFL